MPRAWEPPRDARQISCLTRLSRGCEPCLSLAIPSECGASVAMNIASRSLTLYGDMTLIGAFWAKFTFSVAIFYYFLILSPVIFYFRSFRHFLSLYSIFLLFFYRPFFFPYFLRSWLFFSIFFPISLGFLYGRTSFIVTYCSFYSYCFQVIVFIHFHHSTPKTFIPQIHISLWSTSALAYLSISYPIPLYFYLSSILTLPYPYISIRSYSSSSSLFTIIYFLLAQISQYWSGLR